MLDENILRDKEFMNLIREYFNNDDIQRLKNIPHHDSNRLNHSLKVAYYSYLACRKMNLNYISAAKSGILHDLFFNRTTDFSNLISKIKLYNGHPVMALENAEKITNLTKLEKDIILSHMWPLSTHFPKYKESFILGAVDAVISTKEFISKFNYKLTYALGVYFIFLCYIIFKTNI